jgi:nickel-dependent lactate racemase
MLFGGYEVFLNREFMDCDLKVLTGFVEPHFFAGFSGGAKAVMPGMASLDTVMRNHGARNIDDPRSTWGMIEGNPLRAEIEEIARMAGDLFIVNVTLNRDKRITGVFAGSLDEAYPAACAFEKQTAMVPVDEPFDIVIASNSGFPLDLNLYQSVKGMSAAEQIRREGGAIIMAAECWDGIPSHGSFGKLLAEGGNPDTLLSLIRQEGFSRDDQWQAQVLAKILKRGPVFLRTSGLSDEQVLNAMLKPCSSIEATIEELLGLYGRTASVCVLPEGPQTIPYLAH